MGWGVVLRAIPIPSLSLWMDEGFSFLAAKTLLETGGITLSSGVEYGFFSVVFHFLVALSLGIFGENEWGFRLPSLIFSSLLPLCAFFFARRFFPRHFFLAPLLFCALLFSSWEIAWASQGRMYALLQFLYCGSLAFALEFFVRRKISALLTTAFLTVGAIFTHQFAISLLPILGIGLIIFSKRQFFRLQNLLLFAGISVVILFFFGNFLSGILAEYHNFSAFYGRWLWDFHGTSLALLFLALLLIGFRGNSFEKKALAFLSFALFLVFFALVFFVPLVNYRYLFPIFPIAVFLIFLGISLLLPANFLSKAEKDNSQRRMIFLASFLTILFFLSEAQFFPRKNVVLESDLQKYEEYRVFTPQADFSAGFHFLKKNFSEGDVVITSAPEIALFYGVSVDAVLPFDFENQLDWNRIARPKTVNLPYFSCLLEVYDLTKDQRGWVIFDEYARQKMPEEVFFYFETNAERVFEKWENPDSGIFVYRF